MSTLTRTLALVGAILTASTFTGAVLPSQAAPAAPVPPAAASPAGAQSLSEPAPRTAYDWPTGAPVPVLRLFDPPAVVWGAGHRGVDLVLGAGAPVLAAADGVVAFAGMVAGRPVVSIDHADGIRTTYEPVETSVSAGQVVRRGEVIGNLRSGHRADGIDVLHWGARTSRSTYVDPLRLLTPPVIRLKPV